MFIIWGARLEGLKIINYVVEFFRKAFTRFDFAEDRQHNRVM